MITKKCAVSITCVAGTLLLFFLSMHAMQIFNNISKWIGVSIGVALFAVAGIVLLVFGKKCRPLYYVTLVTNAIASGIASSSLFVYVGQFPAVWHSALLFLALCVLFVLYCLLTNLSFFRRHYVIPLIIYILLILAGEITAAVLTHLPVFYLALIALIPFIAFMITLVTPAKDYAEQLKTVTQFSFAALLVVLIVVILVISQGEGIDGFDGGGGGGIDGGTAQLNTNPYDYAATVRKQKTNLHTL